MKLQKLSLILVSTALIPFGCNMNPEEDTVANEDVIEEQYENNEVVEEELYDADEVREFVMEFASFNMLTMEVSKTAAERSTMQKLKDLANSAMQEHRTMESELKSLAEQNGWSLPQTMQQEDADRFDEFKEVDPDDLNGEYLELIVDQHQEMLDEMKDDLEEAGDNDAWGIAAWITKWMPKLKMHKNQAEELKDMSPKAN